MKVSLLFVGMLLALPAVAQEDVTSYIVNPSFDEDVSFDKDGMPSKAIINSDVRKESASYFWRAECGPATEEQIADAVRTREEYAANAVSAMHLAADKAAASDTLASYIANKELATLTSAIAIAEMSEAKYAEVTGEGSFLSAVADSLANGNMTYGSARSIVEASTKCVWAYMASDEAASSKLDSVVTLLRNVIDTYVPVYKQASELKETLTSEMAKEIVAAELAAQTEYFEAALRSSEEVNACVARLKYIMAEACKQDAYVDPTQPDPNPVAEIPGYVYQWGDEFNYEGAPDGDLWQMETGFVRGQEEQYYQKDNALVTGGRLLITGKKERVLNADYDPSSGDWRKNRQYGEYTSSSLLGKNRRHFLYGHIEVRAKLDISNGAFPAIWTCGYNKDWPQNGEIDIMEYYKTGNNYVLTSNFCVGGDQTGADGKWAQKWKSVFTNRDYYLAKDPDWFSKYHIFSMDWDEKTISLKVDGEERNSCDIESFLNWDGSVCFNNPQFMMLNLAIKNFGDGIADKITFEVDYFRVYQKVRDIETPTEVKNLKAVRVTATTATIAWEPASDDTGILRYDIYCGGKSDGYYRGSTTSTSFTLTGLKQKTLHQIYVRALDGVGNHSSATQVNVLTKSTVGFDRVDYKEGERLFYNGKTYVVGRNLIENNSFDNGFASWYDGTNKAELSSKGWKINSDGGVDGNWLQSLGNTGKTGLSSLSTAWEISPDSIYLFGFYASAQSTINDAAKWQCVSATDAKGVETTMLLGPNGANGQLALTNGDDSWRYTSIVYDNTLNRHKYLQCCFRWEQMGAIGFDCFQLCPLIEDVALGVSAVHDDGDVSGQSVIYNISGQRVCKDKISSGIYIINGKKTVIK